MPTRTGGVNIVRSTAAFYTNALDTARVCDVLSTDVNTLCISLSCSRLGCESVSTKRVCLFDCPLQMLWHGREMRASANGAGHRARCDSSQNSAKAINWLAGAVRILMRNERENLRANAEQPASQHEVQAARGVHDRYEHTTKYEYVVQPPRTYTNSENQ